MKRLFIATLFSVALLTGFCLAFDDIQDPAVAGAVDILSEFSIINGYTDGTFKPGNNIMRSEFCKIIVCATLNEGTAVEGDLFSDVPDTHWAADYIAVSKALGIINGTSPTTFRPEDLVTYEQAIKMIVAALGYEEESQQAGGWPDGYMNVANDLGLTDGVSYRQLDYATRGDIALIVENALHVPSYFLFYTDDGIGREKNELTLFDQHEMTTAYDPQEIDAEEPDGILYVNDSFGFTLLLPSSWADLYEAKETTFGVNFFHIANAATDWGGYLFGVIAEEELLDYPGYWEIARAGGLIFHATGPTDIQFDPENEGLMQEYLMMEEDISAILETFQLN